LHCDTGNGVRSVWGVVAAVIKVLPPSAYGLGLQLDFGVMYSFSTHVCLHLKKVFILEREKWYMNCSG